MWTDKAAAGQIREGARRLEALGFGNVSRDTPGSSGGVWGTASIEAAAGCAAGEVVAGCTMRDRRFSIGNILNVSAAT